MDLNLKDFCNVEGAFKNIYLMLKEFKTYMVCIFIKEYNELNYFYLYS